MFALDQITISQTSYAVHCEFPTSTLSASSHHYPVITSLRARELGNEGEYGLNLPVFGLHLTYGQRAGAVVEGEGLAGAANALLLGAVGGGACRVGVASV